MDKTLYDLMGLGFRGLGFRVSPETTVYPTQPA